MVRTRSSVRSRPTALRKEIGLIRTWRRHLSSVTRRSREQSDNISREGGILVLLVEDEPRVAGLEVRPKISSSAEREAIPTNGS
jgi:hypothetical protein